MIDLSRFRSLALVAAALTACVLLLNSLLMAITGARPAWLVPEQTPMGWDQVDDADQRIAGLAQEQSSGAARTEPPLLVYLGLSTAREGIEPALLQAESGFPCRVLGLCGAGGVMEHLNQTARSLLWGPLQPKRVLVCLRPEWLVGSPIRALEASIAASGSGPASLRQAAKEFKDHWAWVIFNKLYVNHLFRTGLYEARTRLFLGLRLNADGFAQPDPDPLRTPYRFGYPDHCGAAELHEQMQKFEAFHWFNPGSYGEHCTAQADALYELLTALQEKPANVTVVLMPVRSELRTRLPAAARESLRQVLRRALPASCQDAVWDLEVALPDTLFSDYGHPNNQGREKLTRLLAERLRKQQAAATAAMRLRQD
jgi:hypothetical protein